jgi:type IV pilus assembly protein PilC
MSIYSYIAKDRQGVTVKGSLEADSKTEAAEILHRKNLVVVSMQLQKRPKKQGSGQKVKIDDVVVFSRQLATLIDAGVALVGALDILSEQIENKRFRQIIISIRQDIEGGTSFYDALSRHPHIFSEFFINMARAGEASGMLDEILDRVATYLEKSTSLSRKIRSGLIYPACVSIMAILITAVLLLKVVPTFKGIFQMLGGNLPLPTLVLIGISDVLRKYFLFLVVILIISSFLFRKYINTEKGRYNFDRQKLKIPLIGGLFRKVAVAKFSRTLSTLVKSGVQILNALEIVGKTAGNKIIENAVDEARIAIRQGEPIASPLAKSGVFPPLVTRMVGVGEQTGQLEKMLSKIADFYEEQVDAAVSGLTSIIEPLVIAFLGIVVGGIVISLFMPIFKITELIAH